MPEENYEKMEKDTRSSLKRFNQKIEERKNEIDDRLEDAMNEKFDWQIGKHSEQVVNEQVELVKTKFLRFMKSDFVYTDDDPDDPDIGKMVTWKEFDKKTVERAKVRNIIEKNKKFVLNFLYSKLQEGELKLPRKSRN